MKLSTKGRYGLRAAAELAVCHGQGAVPLRQVASVVEVSEAYLEQLLATLRRAGLVESVRGAQGGYRLARAPGEITVGDVLRALEGSMAPAECVAGPGASCANMASCATRRVWEKMQTSLNQVMDSITLQDMLEDELRMRAQCGKAAGGCECTTVHKKEENTHG